MTAVDLFAGMGGWDLAARTLGHDPIGLEVDPDACATRALNGLRTIRTDIATYPPERFAGVEGLIASPPCQDFSVAGSGVGIDGERGRLVSEVLRWADIIRPRWIACEQVPPVEPIWRAYALTLRGWGYRTWVGLLNAEQYGVPQTRQRAILMAHRDRPVGPPAPTHQRYVPGEAAGAGADCVPSMFGPGVKPWVSMAEALGVGDSWALRHPRGQGMIERHGERRDRPADEPAMTMTGKGRSWEWVLTDRQPNGAERAVGQPAPTITASLDNGNKRWVLHTRCGFDGIEVTRDGDEPSPTLTGKVGGQWYFDHQPATTDAIRLTVDQALVLQSFPPDMPLAGTKTAQFRQVGNAIPPGLAAPILAELVEAA